jgi:K(+)-stimulated pyrophosphate-energized sodium pump
MLPETMKMNLWWFTRYFIYACFYDNCWTLLVVFFSNRILTGLGTKPVWQLYKIVYWSRNKCNCRFGNWNDFYFSNCILFAAAIWTTYALAGFYGVALAVCNDGLPTACN